MRKKEKDLIEVLEKMQAYVALAEEEIETRKKESESLRKELSASRILNGFLHDKLQHRETMLLRQQLVARVSQFQMPRIESGGIIELCLGGGELILGTSTNS